MVNFSFFDQFILMSLIIVFYVKWQKNRSNQISLVLLKKIGNPVINKEYSKDKILKFLKKELSN